MAELQADFELLPRETLEAEMELLPREEIEATFEMHINADGRDAKINGVNTLTLTATDGIQLTQIEDVATLSAPGLKQDIANEKTARENADTALDGRIDTVAGNLAQEVLDRETADSTLQDNIDAEATARGNADDTLQDNIDAEETARKAADEDLQDAIDTKQPIINDLSTIRSNAQAGKSASDTIATYGDIVTHDVDEFATAAQGGLADTALQPGDNVSELVNDADYATKTEVSTAVSNHNTSTSAHSYIQGLISAEESRAEGVEGTLTNLTTSTKTNLVAAINEVDSHADTNANDISTINGKIPSAATPTNQLADKDYVDTADTSLQNQIDTLKARGRFLALWNCATGLAESNPPTGTYTYQSGDYFIVGVVSSADPAVNYKPDGSTYTTGVPSTVVETAVVDVDDVYYYDGNVWRLQVNTQKTTSFVNIAGDPYDNTALATALNAKQDTISDLTTIRSNASAGKSASDTIANYGNIVTHNTNEFATSAQGGLADTALQPGDNISELNNDAGYITSSSLPTVNNATLTIQKNGSAVATFTANSATNTTANITVPTKTSDLTNDDGFITGITSSDVTTALGYTPYDSANPSGYISGITSLMVTTALGYTPYDASNPNGYISGITSGDVTTALGYTPYDSSNPSGYISGITSGDVTTALGYTPVNPSSLATVATTGDYDDLINKPTIPTSNDYWTVGSSSDTSVQKTYGRKILTYKATNDQDNGFKLLGTEWVPSGSYSGYWLGRMLLGTDKHTFLLGTVINGQGNYMCGMGAHSWTNAETQTGAAWDDIYIQPDGAKAVYLGGRQWRYQSGWFKVQNDGNATAAYRTFINTGTNTSPTWRTVLPNQATGSNSVLIKPSTSATFSYTYGTSINGTVTANYGSSYGYNSSAGSYATALGYNATASGSYSVQLGYGTNSTANTMNVGLSSSLNVQLLDSAGEIPDARIKTTIARVSQIPTTASDVGALPDTTDYAADLSYSNDILQLLDQDGNAIGNPVTIQASGNVDVDGKSITKNADDEIQTVGVIDQNNTNNAIKTWTGTLLQYQALVNGGTVDSNTIYNITDDTNPTTALLEAIYPVGSIYIGTMSVCPLATLFGTWTLVAADRVLQGAGTRGSVGTTVNESLPNIKGTFNTGDRRTHIQGTSGALYQDTIARGQWGATSSTTGNTQGVGFDASRFSSTYQDSAPVQPDAYLVNIWERTA